MPLSQCPACGAEARLVPNTSRPLGDVRSYMEWQCTSDPSHVFEDENTLAHAQTRSYGDH
ncbi:hypothetical protein [Naasia aerilata]|uniref:Uncharacterized protein n=1 Tax=Naasia aerilata TaxID=1162966 RepID=A0ABM8GF16_9MICO|nr:hypothetical protein [Naasia aerilata]BDZ46688.1 hypothetical protein GCM10025866_25970 [Naasia aerilata]